MIVEALVGAAISAVRTVISWFPVIELPLTIDVSPILAILDGARALLPTAAIFYAIVLFSTLGALQFSVLVIRWVRGLGKA